MRRIVAFATILGFVATTSMGLAVTKKGSQDELTISGKVSAIENGVLSLKERNGQIFDVAAGSDKLKGIKVGDRVAVRDVNGWAVSIHKTTGKAEMNHQTKQMAAATAPTEITGTVTSIKGNSLKVKDEKGKTHSIKAASSKELQGIKVGDSVNVKLEKGKVVSIEKAETTMPSATPEAK